VSIKATGLKYTKYTTFVFLRRFKETSRHTQAHCKDKIKTEYFNRPILSSTFITGFFLQLFTHLTVMYINYSSPTSLDTVHKLGIHTVQNKKYIVGLT